MTQKHRETLQAAAAHAERLQREPPTHRLSAERLVAQAQADYQATLQTDHSEL